MRTPPKAWCFDDSPTRGRGTQPLVNRAAAAGCSGGTGRSVFCGSIVDARSSASGRRRGRSFCFSHPEGRRTVASRPRLALLPIAAWAARPSMRCPLRRDRAQVPRDSAGTSRVVAGPRRTSPHREPTPRIEGTRGLLPFPCAERYSQRPHSLLLVLGSRGVVGLVGQRLQLRRCS